MTLHDDNKGLQHYIEEIAQVETGMDTAEMWQPAIIIDGHPEWGPPTQEDWKALLGRRVRIRPMPEGHVSRNHYRKYGCEGTIFEVSTEDAGSWDNRLIVCEHEILTD